MRKSEEFFAFGNKYCLREYSAADSFTYLLNEMIEDVPPLKLLTMADASVYDEKLKRWVKLDSRQIVNKYVKDIARGIANHLVLNGIILLIRNQNVGFLVNEEWKPLKVPTRLRSNVEPIRLEHVDPILSTLVANHLATLKELQEFYSLKDAFDMFDVFSADSLSKALASDAALAESKAK